MARTKRRRSNSAYESRIGIITEDLSLHILRVRHFSLSLQPHRSVIARTLLRVLTAALRTARALLQTLTGFGFQKIFCAETAKKIFLTFRKSARLPWEA